MSAANVMTYWIKSLEFYQQWKFIEKIYQTELKQNEKKIIKINHANTKSLKKKTKHINA